MGFGLAELRKTVRRSGGEQYLIPYLLRDNELFPRLQSAIAYVEALLGQPRSAFVPDRITTLVRDYRLARCITAALLDYYDYRTPDWEEQAGPEAVARLALAHITSPVQLRLRLYDVINETYGGFVSEQERGAALASFCASYDLDLGVLERLLELDDGANMVLCRRDPAATRPPTPAQLAARYNRRAFDVLLFNASTITFTVERLAGSMLKDICYLARRSGVCYEVEYAEPPGAAGKALPTRAVAERRAGYLGSSGADVRLVLYGPQELTGSPAQYGYRLVKLCRSLLGYHGYRGARQQVGQAAPTRGLLSGRAGLEGVATVHWQGRPFLFTLDASLLELLAEGPDHGNEPDHSPVDPAGSESPVPLTFDSGVEQQMYAEFSALKKQQAVSGWELQREPDPILFPDLIFIPDFAFVRGPEKIYVEIAGFWTPGYLERKRKKLEQLQGRIPLILAVPVVTQPEFARLTFPLVSYTSTIRVLDFIRLLNSLYNSYEQRRDAVPVTAIRNQVAATRFILESDLYPLLTCYNKSELLGMLPRLTSETVRYLDGFGLCSADFLAEANGVAQRQLALAPQQTLPLDALVSVLQQQWPGLANEEALLEQLPACEIIRPSLFERLVTLRS